MYTCPKTIQEAGRLMGIEVLEPVSRHITHICQGLGFICSVTNEKLRKAL